MFTCSNHIFPRLPFFSLLAWFVYAIWKWIMFQCSKFIELNRLQCSVQLWHRRYRFGLFVKNRVYYYFKWFSDDTTTWLQEKKLVDLLMWYVLYVLLAAAELPVCVCRNVCVCFHPVFIAHFPRFEIIMGLNIVNCMPSIKCDMSSGCAVWQNRKRSGTKSTTRNVMNAYRVTIKLLPFLKLANRLWENCSYRDCFWAYLKSVWPYFFSR